MARVNRKRNDNEQPVVSPRIIGVVLVILAVAFGYFSLHARCERLCTEIRRLEGQCEISQRRAENEETKWAALVTPRSIEEALVRHGLNLSWPRRGQVVRIYDSRSGDLTLVDSRDAVRFAQLERVALNE